MSEIKSQQQLARTLVVELLAYQLCSPVKWIDTQEVLLAEQHVERLIEIGPSDVLTGMAKRTIAAKNAANVAELPLRTKTWSWNSNSADISYTVEPDLEKESQSQVTNTKVPSFPPDSSAARPTPKSIPLRVIEDIEPSTWEVLRSVVACGLKRPLATVDPDQTIAGILGGRSALQNEMIGNLEEEFVPLPDGCEDMSLQYLSSTLQRRSMAQLGKHSLRLIQKLISSKMPPNFTLPGIRKHLFTQWLLPTGRQEFILLTAVTSQPVQRLASDDDAKTFPDNLAKGYIEQHNLDINPSAPKRVELDYTADPEALNAIRAEQARTDRQILNAYLEKLGIDNYHEQKEINQLEQTVKDLQAELDVWTKEHGDIYEKGVHPMFNALKVRNYDSSWNWNHEDLISTAYRIVSGVTDIEAAKTGELLNQDDEAARLLARIDQRVLNSALYLRDTFENRPGQNYSVATKFLQQLIDGSAEMIGQPARVKINLKYARAMGQLRTDSVSNKSHNRQDRLLTVQETGLGRSKNGGGFTSNNHQIEPTPAAESDCLLSIPSFKLNVDGYWEHAPQMINEYLDNLEVGKRDGFSFQDKYVLVTGAGNASIAAGILEKLLAGGAKVVLTTSTYSTSTIQHFQQLYRQFGARGSRLVLLPCNQGSQQDIDSLVSFIYDVEDGLGWDLDILIPFAAISVQGSAIDNINSRSELALRLMLTNTVRLLGAVKVEKARRNFVTHPTQVIVPLSPNHGGMGHDGLYAESKLGLEALFDKWHSEDWADYISLCGVNPEGGAPNFLPRRNGNPDFDPDAGTLSMAAQLHPLIVDLSGGMSTFPGLSAQLAQIRKDLLLESQIQRAVVHEDMNEKAMTNPDQVPDETKPTHSRARLVLPVPNFPDTQELAVLRSKLEGMVDLESVVVVTGFAECGPLGNSRTRWEMEAHGRFSVQGYIELAWIMGLIKSHRGPLDGKLYSGWIEVSTGHPIADDAIQEKFSETIAANTGIRIVDRRGDENSSRSTLQEILVRERFGPLDVSLEIEKFYSHCSMTGLAKIAHPQRTKLVSTHTS